MTFLADIEKAQVSFECPSQHLPASGDQLPMGRNARFRSLPPCRARAGTPASAGGFTAGRFTRAEKRIAALGPAAASAVQFPRTIRTCAHVVLRAPERSHPPQ